ncbi:MAG: hypothetical protein ACI4QA_06345 [Candidatus Spyradosoma sp.]
MFSVRSVIFFGLIIAAVCAGCTSTEQLQYRAQLDRREAELNQRKVELDRRKTSLNARMAAVEEKRHPLVIGGEFVWVLKDAYDDFKDYF